jgi:hypothetical protein
MCAGRVGVAVIGSHFVDGPNSQKK